MTDLEVTQLVRLLVGRHHPQPVAEVVLLQVLLRQVLQVPGGNSVRSLRRFKRFLRLMTRTRACVSPFGELLLRRDVDLVLHAADLDDVAQISRLPVDLDPLFEEGFLLDRAQ